MIQSAVGIREDISRIPMANEWPLLYIEIEKQAITGLTIYGLNILMGSNPVLKDSLSQEELLQWISVGEMIRQRNDLMNKAVVSLCRELEDMGVTFMLVKGQTLNAIYPEKGIRQSGDIDFIVHPDSWDKAYRYFADTIGEDKIDAHTEKHVEWEKDGVAYEMHRWLNDFATKKHQQYWDDVVMKEAWNNTWKVEINGRAVSTLAPTYNALYVFVHLFYHFVNEGVGLRQFVDWALVLEKYSKEISRDKLEAHLEGVGLKKAYCGLGAVLTDYLGLPEVLFPFEISEMDHKVAPKVVDNIIKVGNFGHNRHYVQAHGPIHGFQQMWSVIEQCWEFGHYAPSESWGYIVVKIRWWVKKLMRMAVAIKGKRHE